MPDYPKFVNQLADAGLIPQLLGDGLGGFTSVEITVRCLKGIDEVTLVFNPEGCLIAVVGDGDEDA